MTASQFEKLKKFKTVSFALWNSDSNKFSDTHCIKEKMRSLHGNVLILGLNPSREINFLENFHCRSGIYDKWYAEAFSKKPFRGAFMTDLISYPESDSKKIVARWRRNNNFRKNNIKNLKKQFDFLRIQNPAIVCIGQITNLLFEDFLRNYPRFSNSDIHHIKHPNGYRQNGRREIFIRDVEEIGRKINFKK